MILGRWLGDVGIRRSSAVGQRDASLCERFGVSLWVSPQKTEPRLHHRRPQLQSLLQLRAQIRLFPGYDVDPASAATILRADAPAGTAPVAKARAATQRYSLDLHEAIPATKVPARPGGLLRLSAERFLPESASRLRTVHYVLNPRAFVLQRRPVILPESLGLPGVPDE